MNLWGLQGGLPEVRILWFSKLSDQGSYISAMVGPLPLKSCNLLPCLSQAGHEELGTTCGWD